MVSELAQKAPDTAGRGSFTFFKDKAFCLLNTLSIRAEKDHHFSVFKNIHTTVSQSLMLIWMQRYKDGRIYLQLTSVAAFLDNRMKGTLKN